MRILLISDYDVPRGGNEVVTLELRRGLRARGHDARLFASNAYAGGGADRADYHCFGTTSRLRAALWCGNPSAFVALRRVLARFRPDVVHVRLFLSQLSPLILPLLRDTPSLYHDGWYRTVCPIGSKVLPDGEDCRDQAGRVCHRSGCVPLAAWPLAMTQLRLWRRWRGVFDAVVANSQSVADRLTASGIDAVEVIFNGVAARAPRPPLGDPPTVVFAGRLAREKGVDILLEAFGQVVAHVPHARLIIAGEGPESHRLQHAATRFGPHVAFLGHLGREALERHSDAAWVQAIPSRGAEAFGNSAAEAMMRGTAVVATARGGFTEYVRHGRTGLLVPPGDPEALASALRRVLSDRDYAESLGQAGRRFAIAAFDQDRFVDRFVSIYERITRRRSGTGGP
jgi:glycosyltransferase involved in cell wall biosynthesis